MLHNTSVTKDPHGCEIIAVRKHHLQDFDGLLRWIREKGYGSTTGIVKLHLHDDDRMSKSCTQSMIEIIKSKCREKSMDPETKTVEFSWNPAAQIAHKVSLRDNVFQYIDAGCTDKERKEFVKRVCKVSTYKEKTSGCCSNHLEGGSMDNLREHMFSEITKLSLYDESMKRKIAQSQQNITVDEDISPIIYGAGITFHSEKQFEICDGFSLSSVDSVLDLLVGDYDGITNPYIYCGSRHSFFPWHIEDGGAFSINYVSAGASKLWFCIPPKYFGLVDKITSGMSLDRSHTACRALLADHKVLLADPEYFKAHHGVPYTSVLQHPGEFIITFPFALHAGFNLGDNLAIAVNFADTQWIEWGIYAPVCSCNPNQVQFDLSNILRKHRPDLLDYYLHATSLVFPAGHPREVLLPSRHSTKPPQTEAITGGEKNCDEKIESVNFQEPFQCEKVRMKDRTLFCPKCQQSFIENRMHRLVNHIKRKHPEETELLLRIVRLKYPQWKPKIKRALQCRVCGKFIRGYRAQLKIHHSKMHSQIPF